MNQNYRVVLRRESEKVYRAAISVDGTPIENLNTYIPGNMINALVQKALQLREAMSKKPKMGEEIEGYVSASDGGRR